MRVRRLQQLVADNQGEDHGYVCDLEDGRCAFRFNPLVWESRWLMKVKNLFR